MSISLWNISNLHHVIPQLARVSNGLIEEFTVLLMIQRHIHGLIKLHPTLRSLTSPHSSNILTVLDVGAVIVVHMYHIVLCRSSLFGSSNLTTPDLNFFLDQLKELSRLFLGFDNGFLRRKGNERLNAS